MGSVLLRAVLQLLGGEQPEIEIFAIQLHQFGRLEGEVLAEGG
ncbi:hypothetical protein [Erythrobacter sp.]|nr:hypothetical protein [Erythrobacter sp.]